MQTNYHVIKGANTVQVTLDDGLEFTGKVIGQDEDKDVAVLLIEDKSDVLKPAAIGTSNDVAVGQKVYAIGNPFGLDHTLTTGIVSGVHREIQSGITGRPIQDAIQTDAAINPGNSGGPLLDSGGEVRRHIASFLQYAQSLHHALLCLSDRCCVQWRSLVAAGQHCRADRLSAAEQVRHTIGQQAHSLARSLHVLLQVIGINTAIYSPSGANSGVGFAIPVDTVRESVSEIIQHGRVIRPVLGIAFAPDASSSQLGVNGILVLSVKDGGPASKAGIKGTSRDSYGRLVLGDIIVGADGKKIKYAADLYRALDKLKVGTTVDLELLRAESKEHVQVTLEASKPAREMVFQTIE